MRDGPESSIPSNAYQFDLENKEICHQPKVTQIAVILNFSSTNEKAISITAAFRDDLIGDSDST